MANHEVSPSVVELRGGRDSKGPIAARRPAEIMRRPPPSNSQYKNRFNDLGVLAHVPGLLIAEISRGLPAPESAELFEKVIADVTLVDGMQVRLHYLLVEHKHRRSTLRWWSCVRAEAV